MDSWGGDLFKVTGNIDDIALICINNPDCAGFNSNGFLKETLSNFSDWYKWTDDSSRGFYTKKPLPGIQSSLGDFDFHPLMDSLGGDLDKINGNIDELAVACRNHPDCVGFNSNGFLKKILNDFSDWYNWTEDSTKGLYTKRPFSEIESPLDDFHFHPLMDSLGGDLIRLTGTMNDIALACRKDPDCLGFNSNGYLKESLDDYCDWYKWTDDRTKGFYTKKSCYDVDAIDGWSCSDRAGLNMCASDPR